MNKVLPFLLLFCFPFTGFSQYGDHDEHQEEHYPYKDQAYELCFPEDRITDCAGEPPYDKVAFKYISDPCSKIIGQWQDVVKFETGTDACIKYEITHYVANWCELEDDDIPLQRHVCPVEIPRPDEVDGVEDGTAQIAAPGIIRTFDGQIQYDYACDGFLPLETDKKGDNGGSPFDAILWEDIAFTSWGKKYSEYSCNLEDEDDYYSYKGFKSGYYTYTQVVKVIDEEAPVAVKPSPVDSCFPAFEGCSARIQLDFCFTDCDEQNGISVFDLSLELEDGSVYDQAEAEAQFGLQIDRPTETGCFQLQAEQISLGDHQLVVRAVDKCGNVSFPLVLEFAVCDRKAPTPSCTYPLTYVLMPTGDELGAMATVKALDFIEKPDLDDCTGTPLQYGVRLHDGEDFDQQQIFGEDDPRFTSIFDSLMTEITFTCRDWNLIGGGPVRLVFIEVYAVDEAGNADYCSIPIFLNENNAACSGQRPTSTFSVRGGVFTGTDAPIEAVEVKVSGERTAVSLTDQNGGFVFEGLAGGQDYTFSPVKEDDWTNGISTFDLVLIQKHILNVQTFDSPLQWLAADLNHNGAVSVSDLILLRRIILGKADEESLGAAWLFFPEAHLLPESGAINSDSLPAAYSINNLDTDSLYLAFTGIKMGDINGTAKTASTEVRHSPKPVALLLEPAGEAPDGNSQSWAVRLEDQSEIEGVQFDLQANAPISWTPGLAGSEDIQFDPEQGSLRLSWVRPGGLKPSSEPLFYLHEKLAGKVRAEKPFDLANKAFGAEVYQDGIIYPLELAFEVPAQETSLFRVFPNPFEATLNLQLNLENGQAVDLQLVDLQGRLLRQYDWNLGPGAHRLELSNTQNLVPGVYFLKVYGEGFNKTIRIVKQR